jgi:CHASE3 domain sensor protein
MLDPVTIIGVASTAFKGLKAAVEAGRELEDCMSQLSQWAGAVADLDKADEQAKKNKNSLFKSLIPKNGKSVEQQAMDAFTAKIQARKQRDELRQLIQYTQGEHGWHEFLRMENQIRKERQETVYAEMERREKLKEVILAVGISVFGITVIGAGIALMVAMKGAA